MITIIRIIDSTMVMIDEYKPEKKKLLQFCHSMKKIGIVDLEISKYVYETIGVLPEGIRFYLHLDAFDRISEYPGIFRYFISHHEGDEKVICDIQINDVREMVQLWSKGNHKQIRIIGLDDLFCHDYESVMAEIKKIFINSQINFCPEDNYHCATALAAEWLLSGGKEVTTSFASCGDRAATEEVYMAMNVVKRYKPNQSLTELEKIKSVFQEITGEKIPPYKPVIGSHIFRVETGIHVDGILKNPANYEAYPPEKVGKKTEIILGKYSGSSSIVSKCRMLSLKIPAKDKLQLLLISVKEQSVKKKSSINNDEFMVLYKEVMFRE